MGVVFLGIIAVALPVAAFAIEWSGDTGLSERHHSHHDTYFVPRSLTTSLVLMAIAHGSAVAGIKTGATPRASLADKVRGKLGIK